MQQERRAAEDVIRGLGTKSARIRALAEANYDRTEIAKFLKIRYQHVRKVLLDAGITGGMRRQVAAEREPVMVDEPQPREATSWDVLRTAGFVFLCEWSCDSESALVLNAKAPTAPGVYAFVVDDYITYVGVTTSGLRTRLTQYCRGHEQQRTSARINKLIKSTLAAGKDVKILVATPPSTEWNGLPVDVAAGLEAGLIAMIRPPWNIRGAI